MAHLTDLRRGVRGEWRGSAVHIATVGELLVHAVRLGLTPSVLLAAVAATLRVVDNAAGVEVQLAHDVEEDGDRNVAMTV